MKRAIVLILVVGLSISLLVIYGQREHTLRLQAENTIEQLKNKPPDTLRVSSTVYVPQGRPSGAKSVTPVQKDTTHFLNKIDSLESALSYLKAFRQYVVADSSVAKNVEGDSITLRYTEIINDDRTADTLSRLISFDPIEMKKKELIRTVLIPPEERSWITQAAEVVGYSSFVTVLTILIHSLIH